MARAPSGLGQQLDRSARAGGGPGPEPQTREGHPGTLRVRAGLPAGSAWQTGTDDQKSGFPRARICPLGVSCEAAAPGPRHGIFRPGKPQPEPVSSGCQPGNYGVGRLALGWAHPEFSHKPLRPGVQKESRPEACDPQRSFPTYRQVPVNPKKTLPDPATLPGNVRLLSASSLSSRISASRGRGVMNQTGEFDPGPCSRH